MSWKSKFPGLYKRLFAASGVPSESALNKRVTRTASDKGLTSEEAMLFLARKYDLGFSREFEKLSADSQLRVNNAIQAPQKTDASSTKIQRSKKTTANKSLSINTPLGQLVDLYLPVHITKEAVEMSETAYPYLYILENSMRNFITVVLSEKYGTDWWATKVTGTKLLDNLATKVEDRLRKEKRASYHGKRGAHEIYYVDFSDLVDLFRSFESDFNPYFKNLKGKLSGFLNKFDELSPSRNVTAHHNPLSPRDKSRLVGYIHDWLSQLDYLKSNKIL